MNRVLINSLFIIICFLLQPTVVNITFHESVSKTNVNMQSKIPPTSKIDVPSSQNKDLILEALYWAVPNGTWYQNVTARLKQISDLGFTILWLPPPSKTYGPNQPNSNGLQMGYEPYDYYDLGQYNQQGSVNTRFGSEADLLNLINATKSYNMSAMADIVLNHNRGGNPPPNGLDFTAVKSGLFLRNASDFNCSDGLTEYDFPDLCTTNPYVRQQIVLWGQWLRDQIGFTDWRFDFVKGYNPLTVKAWTDSIGGFSVVEDWESLVYPITNYLQMESNSTKAFDFPLMYTFLNLFSRNGNFNMSSLLNPENSLLMTDPSRAVTMVDNHDTVREPANEIIAHRDFMYAFILLYNEGTPSVFWRDLYPNDSCVDPAGTCKSQLDVNYTSLQTNLIKLLNIRKDYASGSGTVLYTDTDLLIYQRNGNPGLILAMNDNPRTAHDVTIATKYKNTILYDLMGTGQALKVDSEGKTVIRVPPLSYVVYSEVSNKTSGIITSLLSINTSTGGSTTNGVGFGLLDTLNIIILSFTTIVFVTKKRKSVK